MGEKPKFREGTGEIQFHPVPFLFLRRPHSNTVLVGDDPIQLRFVSQLTGAACEGREFVADDDLLGKENALYRVLTAQSLRLSPQVRARTGIYSLAPITSGSVAANTLTKVAAELMGGKFDRDQIDAVSRAVGREFQRDELADLRSGLWRAFYLLSGPLAPSRWAEPWETQNAKDWMPSGVKMGMRLGYLFKTLKAYTLLHNGLEAEAKPLGLSPSRVVHLKALRLDAYKVRASLLELSRWYQLRLDDRITTLVLTAIWQS